MKKYVLFLLVPVLFSSCYAFLKADKLIYSGTLAKKPVSTIQVDSVYNVDAEVE